MVRRDFIFSMLRESWARFKCGGVWAGKGGFSSPEKISYGLQRCDLEKLNRWLNNAPMSLIGYDSGERAMRVRVSTITG